MDERSTDEEYWVDSADCPPFSESELMSANMFHGMHKDLVAVYDDGRRIFVFHRNGMKWANALGAVLGAGMVDGLTQADANRLTMRPVPQIEKVSGDVPKAPRRQKGSALTTDAQFHRSLLRRAGLGPQECPLPPLSADATRTIAELKEMVESRDAQRASTKNQYGVIKAMEAVLGGDLGVTQDSSVERMKDVISANSEAFSLAQEEERIKHDEFVGLRLAELEDHLHEFTAEERGRLTPKRFAAAGCHVEACILGLLEADESGLDMGVERARLREHERAGRLPGVFWTGEDGDFIVLPVDDRHCRQLSGRTRHVMAAGRLRISLEAYWMALDDMIMRIKKIMRMKRSRARDLARHFLVYGMEPTRISLNEAIRANERWAETGMKEDRRRRAMKSSPQEARDSYDYPSGDEAVQTPAHCDGWNGRSRGEDGQGAID